MTQRIASPVAKEKYIRNNVDESTGFVPVVKNNGQESDTFLREL